MKEKTDIKGILSIAGAFMAWVIGSGFATGQEILQFFASFGYWGYLGILITFAGFIAFGLTFTIEGYRQKNNYEYNQFTHFCGTKLGKAFQISHLVILIPLMSVLISGAGSTLNEYFGINHTLGALIMAIAVYGTYIIGFQRFVKLAGTMSPLIITFCIIVGTITTIRDMGNFNDVSLYSEALALKQNSPNAIISGLLYVNLNCLCGSVYFTGLGTTAKSSKQIKYGVILGTTLMSFTLAIINTGILLNAGNTAGLDIPNLYLAKSISFILGGLFSIFLVMGIFSSCSAMMWSVCSRFETGNLAKDRLKALGISIGTFLMALINFSDLISTFYPLMGYIGVIYTLFVFKAGFKLRHDRVQYDILEAKK